MNQKSFNQNKTAKTDSTLKNSTKKLSNIKEAKIV